MYVVLFLQVCWESVPQSLPSIEGDVVYFRFACEVIIELNLIGTSESHACSIHTFVSSNGALGEHYFRQSLRSLIPYLS